MSKIIPYGGDRPPFQIALATNITPSPIRIVPLSQEFQNRSPVVLAPIAPPSPPTPDPQWVELTWTVQGDRIPADHGYRLYSALVERMPGLKDLDWQLNTITGIPDHQGWVKLGRRSRLLIRCPIDLVPMFGALDSTLLRVGQTFLQLGALEGNSLMPHETLESRLVIIKLKHGTRVDEFKFGVALGKQLQELGIESVPALGDRGCIQVKDHKLVGYGVRFTSLRPEESLKLQIHGIGGKRRMGCGVFVKF